MFDNLVTYHVHQSDPLPANNALAYQYVLAGNGLFIRAETRFFEAILPISSCTVRGLAPLHHHFRLKVPRIPARLLDTILANARRTRDQTVASMKFSTSSTIMVKRSRQRNHLNAPPVSA